jgi:hypothetical protein
MPLRPELRHTAREAMAEDYLDVATRRPGGEPVGHAPPVRGAPSVTGILANGRLVQLRSREEPVPLGDLDQLVGTLRRMGEDGDAAIRARSRAIARLSRTVASDAAELARASRAARRKREVRLRAGSARLDRRIDKELIPLSEEIAKQGAHHELLVRRVARRALWDDLVVVSAYPLFAAFGQRGNPFDSNNLTLTLSLLVWLLGDELTDLISGSDTVFGIRDTDLWSYIAPAANLLTGWFLLRNAQNERFITGTASDFQMVSGGPGPDARLGPGPDEPRPDGGNDHPPPREKLYVFVEELDLLPSIALDHRDDFQSFEDVPVVASVMEITWAPGLEDPASRRLVGLTAVVEEAILILTVTVAVSDPKKPPHDDAVVSDPKKPPHDNPVLSALSAAWIVDTADPKA